MKKIFLLALVVSSSQIKAQEPAPVRSLATIEPQARDLLARLDARYKKYRTFQGVVNFRGVEEGKVVFSTRFRVQLGLLSQGVVTVAEPKRGVQKRVFDGQTVLATDSKFPRRFTKEKLDAERYSLLVFLKRSGAEGFMVNLLTNDTLASLLLDPDLQSISMGARVKVDEIELQNVVFKIGGKEDQTSLSLLVDEANLVLRRVVGIHNTPAIIGEFYRFTETYSEIKSNEALPNQLFSVVAPAGYRVIDSFETDTATTTPPVENLIVK